MKKVFDLRKKLWDSFEGRAQRNSSYSLRAFARDLDVSVSTLSQVMNNKRELSPQMAEKISQKIGLSATQTRLFIEAANAQSSRIPQLRSKSKENVKAGTVPALSPRKVIAKNIPFEITWRHLALRELVSFAEFTPEPKWLAEKLSISSKAAVIIWEECLQGGYIIQESDGSYKSSEHLHFIGEKNDANTALKKLYKNVLSIATEKTDAPRENRDLSMTMLSVSKQQYLDLIKSVRLFSSETTKNFKDEDTNEKEFVVCWATQIFKV